MNISKRKTIYENRLRPVFREEFRIMAKMTIPSKSSYNMADITIEYICGEKSEEEREVFVYE